MIYNRGVLNVSGTGVVNLIASSTGMYGGIAIYQAQSNTNAVTVTGHLNLNSELLYDANVQSTVTISGNGTVKASLVVNELTISGNADETAQ